MRDASLIIPNRAVELFAASFDRLFVEPLKDRIPDVARRRQVERVIGEISDAAAMGLSRFLKGEPPEGVDIDSLFDAIRLAIAAIGPDDVWPPLGLAEARAQEVGGPPRSPDWQREQSARFGVALDLVFSALWQAGEVLHAWAQVQFGVEYEPPRQLVRQLHDLGGRQPNRPVPTPAYTDDDSFEARYRDYLLQRWGRLDVGTLRAVSSVTVRLGDLFVLPSVAHGGVSDRPADTAVFDGATRFTVMLGPPGSGKSTLLLWVQQQVALCERELVLGDGQALPVLIRVRELQGVSSQGVLQGRRLVELATGSRDFAALMPDGWIDRRFASGQVLLLLDGLDETDASTRDAVLFPWLANLLKNHPVWRVVATSRPAGFPESAFMSSESSEGTFSPWHPAVYTLQEFGREEVIAYLRNWCMQVRIANNEPVPEAARRGQEDADQIAAAVARHPAVENLARTPLLLSAICLVYRFEGGSLPDDRVALYRLCVEGLLDRWDAQKGLRSLFTAEEKLQVCRELAAWMMYAGRRACTYSEARHVAKKVLGNPASAEALIGHVLNRAGLLIERQPGILSFAHLTFQEYLTALAVRDENAQGVTIGTLAKAHFHPWWHEVILLFCRLAPPALVRHLLDCIRTARLPFPSDADTNESNQMVDFHFSPCSWHPSALVGPMSARMPSSGARCCLIC